MSFLRCGHAPAWWPYSSPALFFCDTIIYCTFMMIQLHLRQALVECENEFLNVAWQLQATTWCRLLWSLQLKRAWRTICRNTFHASFLHLKSSWAFGNMLLFFLLFEVEEALCLKIIFHCPVKGCKLTNLWTSNNLTLHKIIRRFCKCIFCGPLVTLSCNGWKFLLDSCRGTIDCYVTVAINFQYKLGLIIVPKMIKLCEKNKVE